MPVAWNVDGAQRRARLTVTDPYTLDEWRSAMLNILQHPEFGVGFHFLVDRRECTPPTAAFIRAAMEFLTPHAARIEKVRTAAVVRNDPTAFGMGRMTELMAESYGLPVTMFTCTSMDEAEHWLGQQAF